jgi:hypothetical protein
MKKKGLISRYTSGYGTGEVSLKKLIFYNLFFFVPIMLLIILSLFIARYLAPVFQTTINVTVQIIMLFFTLILFFIIIPVIRRRESVIGVRYSLIGFIIVAIGLTLPSIILEWDWSLLFIELPHIATYILLTFIFCPEVLGMDIDISKWFQHFKQIFMVIVYCSIVFFYVAGFGGIFYNMAVADPGAFEYSIEKPVEYPRYLYFSIISFATIGYGDITPVSTGARFLVCVEALIGSIVNVVFIAILFVYVSNFQIFLRGLKKEEKMIKKEEMLIQKEEAVIKKLAKKKKR